MLVTSISVCNNLELPVNACWNLIICTNSSVILTLEVSKKDNYDDWFLGHHIYDENKPVSSAFNDVKTKLVNKIAQLEQADFAALTRIKANFYPQIDTM